MKIILDAMGGDFGGVGLGINADGGESFGLSDGVGDGAADVIAGGMAHCGEQDGYSGGRDESFHLQEL